MSEPLREKTPRLIGLPEGMEVIDLFMGLPSKTTGGGAYDFLKPLLMDKESREQFSFPAEYIYKHLPVFQNLPKKPSTEDYLDALLREMDKYNVARAMITFVDGDEMAKVANRRNPDRFFFDYNANPNGGMEEVRKIRGLKKDYDIKAVCAFPAGLSPPAPINDKKWYPIYAACVDLDIAFFCCVGVPGPRVPVAPQKVELIDEVCWFFPELRFVMRHGGEPWEALAVKLMLKYPNLYYSTSAFAPKRYPKAIMDYANSRGSDKILYAGYFPVGLTLERIFRDLREIRLREDVWPKFLHQNAKRVLKL